MTGLVEKCLSTTTNMLIESWRCYGSSEQAVFSSVAQFQIDLYKAVLSTLTYLILRLFHLLLVTRKV